MLLNLQDIGIHIGDAIDRDITLHEYGHYIMRDISDNNGGQYPDTRYCYPHGWVPVNLECAWAEGWI